MKRWLRHSGIAVLATLALLGGPRAALAVCTSPAGTAGTITWNGTDSVIWCNGTTWYALKDAGGAAAGSTGQVQFNNASNALAADAGLTWDNTNKRLGIGTSSPASLLSLNSSGDTAVYFTSSGTNTPKWFLQTVTSAGTGGRFRLYENQAGTGEVFSVLQNGNVGIGTATPAGILNTSVSGGTSTIYQDIYGGAANFTGRRANGTSSSPTALVTDDAIASFQAQGYTGSAFSANRATIAFKAAENWSGTNNGTYINFVTTANGGTSNTEKMRITDAGNVGIGTTAPSNFLDVVAANTGGTQITVQNSNSSGGRAGINISHTAAGGGFVVQQLSDGHAAIQNYGANSYINFVGNNIAINSVAVPGSPLTVNGALGNPPTTGTTRTGIQLFTNSTDTGMASMGIKASGAGFWIQSHDSTQTTQYPLLLNPSGGNVLIGRTTTSASTPAGLTIQHTYGVNYALVLVSDNVGASSVVRFDNPNGNVGSIVVAGTGVTYNTASDRRLKENITDTQDAMDKVLRIPVHDFSFKTDSAHKRQTGFIAQELEKVFPEAVTTNGDNGETPLAANVNAWSVDYGRVTPLLVKAIQELKAANDNLQATVEAQGAEIEALKAAVH